jgi:DNA-binding PadR family transcriptional regulator
MPAEHAILGLLAESDPGAHGYDLARHFTPEEPLGAIVRLEPGMLYHHLKKLDKAGWVSATVEQQGVRPPRQVYQLTPEGREELDRWLGDPVGRTREIRLEFLVKLFFAQRLHPNLAGELVEHQRDTLVRNLASLKAQQQSMAAGGDADDRDRSFSVHVLELRSAQTEAALSWLDDLIANERKGSAE